MNATYLTNNLECVEKSETGVGYTEFRKIGTNPDRFIEFQKYNPMKFVYWSMAGIAGLTAIVTGTILTIKHFKKEK